jgi:RHS repeat-associated protein
MIDAWMRLFLAMLRGGATHYYGQDGLGSVTSLFATNGTTATSYSYSAFGQTAQTGSVVNPFRFTGREFDAETGLYYYRARYYDPKVGRFLNEDPIGFGGGINFYRYVDNNPANYRDSFGLQGQGNVFPRNVRELFDEAMLETTRQFPAVENPHNNAADAFRHCYASCLVAREASQLHASFWGWLNERAGNVMHNQTRGELEMDNYNNMCGRQIAANSGQCLSNCLSAARSGILRIDVGESTPHYIDWTRYLPR